jgi:hypothetical protein
LAREQPQAWKLLPDIDDANLKAELAQRLRTTNVLGEEEESAPTIQETNLGTSAPTRGEGGEEKKKKRRNKWPTYPLTSKFNVDTIIFKYRLDRDEGKKQRR